MRYKTVVFDLDGTLVDSHGSIYQSTIKTLDELNYNIEIDEVKFQRMIGFHFRDIFDSFGIGVDDVDHFIEVYKSHYFEYIDRSIVYPGVIELLNELKNLDIKVALLTTKGEKQAKQIAKHFKIAKYFDIIKGWLPGEEIKPSPKPLIHICNKLHVDPSDAIIIGDAEIDVRCGKNAGSNTCAVTYGYRSAEMLKKENPDYIVHSAKEILPLITNNI